MVMRTVVRIVSGGGMVAAASSGPVVVPCHCLFVCLVVVLVKKLG